MDVTKALEYSSWFIKRFFKRVVAWKYSKVSVIRFNISVFLYSKPNNVVNNLWSLQKVSSSDAIHFVEMNPWAGVNVYRIFSLESVMLFFQLSWFHDFFHQKYSHKINIQEWPVRTRICGISIGKTYLLTVISTFWLLSVKENLDSRNTYPEMRKRCPSSPPELFSFGKCPQRNY